MAVEIIAVGIIELHDKLAELDEQSGVAVGELDAEEIVAVVELDRLATDLRVTAEDGWFLHLLVDRDVGTADQGELIDVVAELGGQREEGGFLSLEGNVSGDGKYDDGVSVTYRHGCELSFRVVSGCWCKKKRGRKKDRGNRERKERKLTLPKVGPSEASGAQFR